MHVALLHRLRTTVPLLLLAVGSAGCASAGGPGFIPPSRPAEFSMAGIPWGISRDSTTALVEPRGYNYNSTDADGDMWFDGVLMNTPTRVFAFMGQDSLARLRVRMITTDENALATYARVREQLIRQYGRPYESSEEYHAPFTKGTNEMEAVKAGKAIINSHWKVGTGRRQTHITVQVPRELVVVIDYDGPNWNREYVRRQRSGN